MNRKGFTIAEMLVVLSIIAILGIVAILLINPAELLRQGRDSNRLSNTLSLNSAVSLYTQTVKGGFLGTSSIVYVSIPDTSATTTAGDQCQGLSLLTLPSSWTYHCASTNAVRKIDGTGWVPVPLNSIPGGSPLGALLLDPTNASSSGLYYTYTTDGTNYEFTASMESAKNKLGGSNDEVSTDGGTKASLYEIGDSFTLEPLEYGDSSLIGYWTLGEGTGTVAYDYSGKNATGTFQGTQSGQNGTYYTTGSNGGTAGYFDGTDDDVYVGDPSSFQIGTVTVTAWFKENAITSGYYGIAGRQYSYMMFLGPSSNAFGIYDWGGTGWHASSASVTDGKWHFAVCTFQSGITNGTLCYLDGSLVLTTTMTVEDQSYPFGIGDMFSNSGVPQSYYFSGAIDNVRLYNRILSAAEIKAMYQAQD